MIGKGGEVRVWEGGPTSIPTTLTPEAQETTALQLPRSSNSPLFSEQQVQKMAQLEHQAPLLQSRREELQRPQWMTEEDEKARLEEERKEEYRQRQMRLLMMHDDEKARMLRINCDLQMDCKKAEAEGKALQHENWKIAKENEAIRKENEALKQKIRSYQKIMEGDGQGAEQPGFSTPDEERKEAGRTSRSEVEEGKTEGGQERPVKEKDDKQFELMMRMMSSMQKMIEKKEESKEEGGDQDRIA